MNKDVVNLFWTSGWDSTFRLLQLLLEEKKQVQPHYIVDAERSSVGMEIKKMRVLKQEILRRYPYTESLLFPVKYVNIESIKTDRAIADAFADLKNFMGIARQHIWLASYCKQHQISGMELAIEDAAIPEHRWINAPYLRNGFADDPRKLPERESKIYTASKTIFQYYSFPIINYSKADMMDVSKANGWMPIMAETWFCYYPINMPFKGWVPCGKCITCKYVRECGLEWRIPVYSKLFNQARRIKKTMKTFFASDG